MYYVWNETRSKEYWCITNDPYVGVQNLVELYNKNCHYEEDYLTVEEFIREYPDGYACKIELDTAYDTEYHSPIEMSSDTAYANSISWEDIVRGGRKNG